jgi:hypothetical protein
LFVISFAEEGFIWNNAVNPIYKATKPFIIMDFSI